MTSMSMASNKPTMDHTILDPVYYYRELSPMENFIETIDLLYELAEAVSLVGVTIGVLHVLMTLTFQVDCNKDLKNLCLVNKTFGEIFSKKLYREISFTINTSLATRLAQLLQTTRVKATRELSF